MKASSSRITVTAIGVLALLGGLCGCSLMVTGGTAIGPEAIEFIQLGVTTKAEVIENLGRPAWDLEEPMFVAYQWEMGMPVSNSSRRHHHRRHRGRGVADREIWAFCVALDQSNRVTRSDYVIVEGTEGMREAILDWLKALPSPDRAD